MFPSQGSGPDVSTLPCILCRGGPETLGCGPGFQLGVLRELDVTTLLRTHRLFLSTFFFLSSVLNQKAGNEILKCNRDPKSMLLIQALLWSEGLASWVMLVSWPVLSEHTFRAPSGRLFPETTAENTRAPVFSGADQDVGPGPRGRGGGGAPRSHLGQRHRLPSSPIWSCSIPKTGPQATCPSCYVFSLVYGKN